MDNGGIPVSDRKPILCVDFDGVLHDYEGGWKGIDVVAGNPVPGAMEFLAKAVGHFDVVVYSSRSKDPRGRLAMMFKMIQWLHDELRQSVATNTFDALTFSAEKPPAFLTIDDRAFCFTGTFPDPTELLSFRSWYEKE